MTERVSRNLACLLLRFAPRKSTGLVCFSALLCESQLGSSAFPLCSAKVNWPRSLFRFIVKKCSGAAHFRALPC